MLLTAPAVALLRLLGFQQVEGPSLARHAYSLLLSRNQVYLAMTAVQAAKYGWHSPAAARAAV
jgi:hypothetical protein